MNIIQPPPIIAYNSPNGSDSRASKLNPSSLHPHPSFGLQLQGVKFNSPTNPALSSLSPGVQGVSAASYPELPSLPTNSLFLGTDTPADDPKRQARASVSKRGRAFVCPGELHSPSPVAQPNHLANIGQEANLQDSPAHRVQSKSPTPAARHLRLPSANHLFACFSE